MKVATIDVGTNTVLLLVAEAQGGALVPLEDRMRIERLGKGVDKSGALDPANVAGALAAIREYADVIRAHGVDRVAAVGTQALREAKNGADFLGPAEGLLGVPVEVIGGEREASLAWTAVQRSFPDVARGEVVVCDIGGGSTELVVASGGVVTSMVSVPIGSVRLTERFLASDPPAPDEAKRMIAFIDEKLAVLPLPEAATVVGTAGTMTTLASVALGLRVYDADRVHGARVGRAEVERQLATFLDAPLPERRRISGLDPKRADVIHAGAAIAARVMARLHADSLIVSDRGIRWGLAYELAERDA